MYVIKCVKSRGGGGGGGRTRALAGRRRILMRSCQTADAAAAAAVAAAADRLRHTTLIEWTGWVGSSAPPCRQFGKVTCD